MTRLFALHVFIQSSDNELLNLRQGSKDLITYITTFNRLLSETHWPEEKSTSLFYRWLRYNLKDSLAQIVELPVDYSEFIDVVVKLDQRLGERKSERPRTDTRIIMVKSDKKETEDKLIGPEPMQIGVVKGPLSQEEKERRCKGNLCLYCGKAGHFAQECPIKSKKNKVVANINKNQSES